MKSQKAQKTQKGSQANFSSNFNFEDMDLDVSRMKSRVGKQARIIWVYCLTFFFCLLCLFVARSFSVESVDIH